MLSAKARQYKEWYEKKNIACQVCGERAENHEIYARGMGSSGSDNKRSEERRVGKEC